MTRTDRQRGWQAGRQGVKAWSGFDELEGTITEERFFGAFVTVEARSEGGPCGKVARILVVIRRVGRLTSKTGSVRYAY